MLYIKLENHYKVKFAELSLKTGQSSILITKLDLKSRCSLETSLKAGLFKFSSISSSYIVLFLNYFFSNFINFALRCSSPLNFNRFSLILLILRNYIIFRFFVSEKEVKQ